jgi:hypothetical protein
METDKTKAKKLKRKLSISKAQKESKNTVSEKARKQAQKNLDKADEFSKLSRALFMDDDDHEGAIAASLKATEFDPKCTLNYIDRIVIKKDCNHPTTSESVKDYLLLVKRIAPEQYDEMYRMLEEDGTLESYGDLVSK